MSSEALFRLTPTPWLHRHRINSYNLQLLKLTTTTNTLHCFKLIYHRNNTPVLIIIYSFNIILAHYHKVTGKNIETIVTLLLLTTSTHCQQRQSNHRLKSLILGKSRISPIHSQSLLNWRDSHRRSQKKPATLFSTIIIIYWIRTVCNTYKHTIIYVWSTSCLVSGSLVTYDVRPTALEPYNYYNL